MRSTSEVAHGDTLPRQPDDPSRILFAIAPLISESRRLRFPEGHGRLDSRRTACRRTEVHVAYMREQLRRIYDKTNGSCHLCGKKLAFTNYGEVGARAAWEVEHSIPLANGGTHHGNNLFASCVPCNRSKAADVSSQ